MNTVLRISIISVFLFVLSACSSQPIHNVERAPVANSLSQEQVRTAIVQAATARGWMVEEDTGSEIVASINVRTHQAKVRIPYTANNYSIQYESSVNLKQRGNSIHRNYNRWVNNLDMDIRRNMNMIAVQ